MNRSLALVTIATTIAMATADTERRIGRNDDYEDDGHLDYLRDLLVEERQARIRLDNEFESLVDKNIKLESTIAQVTRQNTELETRINDLTSDMDYESELLMDAMREELRNKTNQLESRIDQINTASTSK